MLFKNSRKQDVHLVIYFHIHIDPIKINEILPDITLHIFQM